MPGHDLDAPVVDGRAYSVLPTAHTAVVAAAGRGDDSAELPCEAVRALEVMRPWKRTIPVRGVAACVPRGTAGRRTDVWTCTTT